MDKIRLTNLSENFDRKVAVARIAQTLGVEKKYLGTPSFAYQIGCVRFFTRKSEIDVAEATGEQILKISVCLNELGCEYELEGNFPEQDTVETEPEKSEQVEVAAEEIDEPQNGSRELVVEDCEDDEVTLQIPDTGFNDQAWQNLINLTIAKGELISKALGINDVAFTKEKGVISFPWIKGEITPIRIEATAALITAMVKMAKEQKRINASEKVPVNEKYAFRCFLLRLGFIGASYKKIRKELLKRLEGSSAFRQPKVEEEEPND